MPYPIVSAVSQLAGTATNPAGQPTPLAASGATIVNTGTNVIYISEDAEVATSLEYVVGSSGPTAQNSNWTTLYPQGQVSWPLNTPCYAWCAPGAGSGIVTIVAGLQGFVAGDPNAVPLGTGTVANPINVAIPSSCRSVDVIIGSSTPANDVSGFGLQSGITYPSFRKPNLLYSPTTQSYTLGPQIFYNIPIKSSFDSTLQISINSTNLPSDTPVLVLANSETDYDMRNDLGMLVTQPHVPIPTNHPPFEVGNAFATFSATNTQILSAAGSTMRYRIFEVELVTTSANMVAGLVDSVSSHAFGLVGANHGHSGKIPEQGIVTYTNAAMNGVIYSGTGTAYVRVVYQWEPVSES